MRRVGLRKGQQLLASELLTLTNLKTMLARHTKNPRISALEKSRQRATKNDQTGLPEILEHIDDVSFLTRRRCVSTRRKANDTINKRREGNMNGNEKGTLEGASIRERKPELLKGKINPYGGSTYD
jgi:hypothetical protein